MKVKIARHQLIVKLMREIGLAFCMALWVGYIGAKSVEKSFPILQRRVEQSYYFPFGEPIWIESGQRHETAFIPKCLIVMIRL